MYLILLIAHIIPELWVIHQLKQFTMPNQRLLDWANHLKFLKTQFLDH